MGLDALRRQFDPAGHLAGLSDPDFARYVAETGGNVAGAQPQDTVAQVESPAPFQSAAAQAGGAAGMSAVGGPVAVGSVIGPYLLGLGKQMASQAASIPEALVANPIRQLGRLVTQGPAASEPTHEEKARQREATVASTALLSGGMADGLPIANRMLQMAAAGLTTGTVNAALQPGATPQKVAAEGGIAALLALPFALLPHGAGYVPSEGMAARAARERLATILAAPAERMPEPVPAEAALASRVVRAGPEPKFPGVPTAPPEVSGAGARTFTGEDWDRIAAIMEANTPEAKLARSVFGPQEQAQLRAFLPSTPTLPPVRVPEPPPLPAGGPQFARTMEQGQNLLNPEPGSPEAVARARMTLGQIAGRTSRVEQETGGALNLPPSVHLLPGEESPFVRMMGEPERSSEPLKRGLRQLALGYHNPSPLAAGEKLSSGQSLNDAFGLVKRQQQDAEEAASVEMERFLRSNLTGQGALKPDQANLVRKYMTAMSFLSDAEAGKPLPSGYTPKQLEQDVIDTSIALSNNPEAQQTAEALRGQFRAMRADLTRRGYNMGQIEHYLPAQGFETLDRLLPESQQRFGTTPSFMKQRGPEADLRNADAFKLMTQYRESYLKKVAEDDLFTKLAADPKVNIAADPVMAAKMSREGVPKGYVQYTMPPGAPGYGKVMLDDAGRPVLGPDGQPKPYTVVLKRNVAEALAKFYPPHMGEAAAAANKAGSFMARSATTYHLGNRAVNLPSDLWMMLAGPAGERGTFTKGLALKRAAAFPGALRDMLRGEMGHPTLPYEEGRRLGAVSGTFQHEIRGIEVPHGTKDYYYPAPMAERTAPKQILKNILGTPAHAMKRLSTITEAAPRLAALKPALKAKTADEAARELVHESSLPYGSGASQFSRSPLSKLTSRFVAYPSLSDVRIGKGLLMAGSRSRYAALLTVPPLVAAQWNTQNPEYANYEKRLKPWVKQSLHFNRKLPDGTFETIVVRADPFSEAMNRWGLGQLSGRALKAAKGVEPLDLSTAPMDALRAYADIYPLGPIIEDVQGQTFYGKPIPSLVDKAANLLPMVRVGQQAAQAAEKGGLKAGLEEAARRTVLSGARPYKPSEVVQKRPPKKRKK